MDEHCERCYAQDSKPCMECNTCNPGHRNFRPVADRHEALKPEETQMELVDRKVLHAELCRLEELARNRYLDTPGSSPASARYGAQLNERTTLKDLIETAPTVDAIPVIRCRECKHYKQNTDAKCVLMEGLRTPSEIDFCSYGERRMK